MPASWAITQVTPCAGPQTPVVAKVVGREPFRITCGKWIVDEILEVRPTTVWGRWPKQKPLGGTHHTRLGDCRRYCWHGLDTRFVSELIQGFPAVGHCPRCGLWQPKPAPFCTLQALADGVADAPPSQWPCDVHTSGEDLPHAYRKIPMKPDHSWACVVAFHDPARAEIPQVQRDAFWSAPGGLSFQPPSSSSPGCGASFS